MQLKTEFEGFYQKWRPFEDLILDTLKADILQKVVKYNFQFIFDLVFLWWPNYSLNWINY